MTCITQNLIEESKSEGIFVVEGEEKLNINENWINKNSHGIVLFNSNGRIFKNGLLNNSTAGIVTLGNTNARLEDNDIEGNEEPDGVCKGSIGVKIIDPSSPELVENKIRNNAVDVEIESKNSGFRKKM